jgi:NADH-quinone oxidoreductase subunit A
MVPYVPLLILFFIGAVLTVVIFLATSYFGPKNPTPEKMTPYECGSESTGGRFVKPSVKFYLTAILFVVFDIEAVLIYPWATQFRALGWTGLATMASFLALIVVALAYVWKKGALEWES